MSAKHTPGPWQVGNKNGYNISTIHAADGETAICNLFLPLNTQTSEIPKLGERYAEDLANARLIAASPDLLKVLAMAYREIRAWRDGLNHRNLNKAKVGAIYADETEIRVAIARAQGDAQ
ncbi:MAG: hypothetical protein KGL39_04785 [Patescibacteria group bacterium]|nr:hypothetical protein [Patescibacteria group bacterium]